MNTNNMENRESMANMDEELELNLGDLLRIIRANWYWFALSLLICTSVAVLYLGTTPKTYTRTATVLIKGENKGGSVSESAMFGDLDLFGGNRNVDNEVLVFKSLRLMTDVTRRLQLDVNYTVKEGLRTVDLYRESPVTLSFPDMDEASSFSLEVTPLSEKKVQLSNFQDENKTSKEVIEVSLSDTIETPIGRVLVNPTLYYSEVYYGNNVSVKKSNLQEVASDYQTRLHSSLASKTATLINLTLQDVSISRAEDVLNTLIAVYNEDAINDKNQIAVNTSNFINERLIIIEKELGNVDANIETYKRENQLTDIVSETGMYLQTTSEYNKEGLGLDNQLTLAHYIREYLTDPKKSSNLIPANTGISDSGIEGQINEYNEMLLKRDKLISNSSDKNPVVMSLNNSLGAMKQTIIRSVDNLIVGLDIKIKNVRERERQTTRRISAVPGQQKYVLSVERQQKIKEALYLYLLNKREENELTQAITESNARIIDPASGNNKPVAPKSMMILMATILLGGIIPAGVLWMLVVTDTKVRDRKDLENVITIPYLGDIPARKKEKGKESTSPVVVHESGRDSISEAFRIIRTNMDFMCMKGANARVIMLTSFNPNAGKTFVSINMAMSFALTGKSVVLVDLDIRKGTLSKRVGTQHKKGVTNYLSGHVNSLDEIISHGEYGKKLDIIHAGPIPPNPAELLLSDRLDTLIEELKKRYEYVILDNVPAGLVADAAIVNRVAEMTIYVVRAGVIDRRQLSELEALYRQSKFNNMCVILNAVSPSLRSYKYGYGYGYGTYEYGYGDKTT